tara:strand:- start:963 stop:1277 length:315 start_codon:yes stop_codon:yes gene_type:complete
MRKYVNLEIIMELQNDDEIQEALDAARGRKGWSQGQKRNQSKAMKMAYERKRAKGCPTRAMQMLLSDVFGCSIEEHQIIPLFKRRLADKDLSQTYEHLAAIIRD